MLTDFHPPEDSPLPNTEQVRAALSNPQRLLEDAAAATPGWSAPYGGPDGVAVLSGMLRHELDALAREISSLRTVAIAEMLREDSLATAGRKLGLGRTGVHKLSSQARKSRFVSLLTKGLW
ncbi:hypothetical protein [Gordonia sihwensis]|uniref:hypothetical protein n=1 Tax=Gordonia sihwensis TaxID=173559 RepID=UPI003D991C4E